MGLLYPRCTPYTLTDVLRWTRQLATALACLASLKPDPVVHGDVKPDNLFVETASGDLVLGDFGVAMWHRLRTGLRPAQWLVLANAFIAPERRLSILGPTSGLSEEEKEATVDELLKKVGGGKLDMWSLGVMTYLLGLRKAPHGYDDPTQEAKIAEVDEVAERVNATEWLQAELHNTWPNADAGEVRQLAAVIAGTLHGHGERLSASDVLELLPTTGETTTTLTVRFDGVVACYS
jgi:serine/threonine protein kinase